MLASILALSLVPTAAAAGPTEGFEGGVTPNGWVLTGLWKVASCQAASGSYSLHYVRVPQCDFDAGSTSGTATSPPIVVDGSNPGMLNFESWIDTEYPEEYGSCDFDTANVLVSAGNGPFSTVIADIQCGPQDAWQLHSIDLTPYAGQTIRVQFAFNTGDASYNAHGGWAIDNIAVTGASYPTPELGSVALVGFGLMAVAGTVVVARRK